MVWVELLLAVVAGAALGALLLAGRSFAPGPTSMLVWVAVASLGVGAAGVLALQPVLVVAVGFVVAVAVAVSGAPWAAARADPHLMAVPYWSRLRSDARLRADVARRAARAPQSAPARRDLSTPDADGATRGRRVPAGPVTHGWFVS